MADGPATDPRSLEDVHGSVAIPRTWWRRFLAFSGPALMVSVGYMDPGNWGTDLAAGSEFKYRLLWVLLMSNLMALLLQTLATRLGVVTGHDLAQACRASYPRRTVWGLWGLTEIAIAATDLAEVIGTIIGLKLLFGLPYAWGLVICTADTFVLLALQRRGVRLLELVTLALVGTIAVCFFVEIVLARPDLGEVIRGFVPGLALKEGSYATSVYVAIGMLGATVMPHNLYLHSALVQTRAFAQTPEGKAMACKYNFFDSAIALNCAFFINASILILAVTLGTHKAGPTGELDREVKTLQEAHVLLAPALGPAMASVLFALALLASGQSSTLTGTLAGQVVMEGFVRLRVRPWVRRLITRLAALSPAVIVVALTGASPDGAGDSDLDKRFFELLVLSQVVLSFQLPFAIIPLVQFTSDRKRMGAFASRPLVQILAWVSAAVVVSMNVVFIFLQTNDWVKEGASPWLIYGLVGPLAVLVAAFLGWVTLYPYLRRNGPSRETPAALPPLPLVRYKLIGVGVEFAATDATILEHAATLARHHGSALLLIHVVEGPGAAVYGPHTADRESVQDREAMTEMVKHLRDAGLDASGALGFGSPPDELVRLANERGLDALVLGAHGHGLLGDLALGHTVSPVLHRLTIPVLVVPPARRKER